MWPHQDDIKLYCLKINFFIFNNSTLNKSTANCYVLWWICRVPNMRVANRWVAELPLTDKSSQNFAPVQLWISADTNFSIYVKFIQTIGHIHSDIWLKDPGPSPVFGEEKNPQETACRSVQSTKDSLTAFTQNFNASQYILPSWGYNITNNVTLLAQCCITYICLTICTSVYFLSTLQ